MSAWATRLGRCRSVLAVSARAATTATTRLFTSILRPKPSTRRARLQQLDLDGLARGGLALARGDDRQAVGAEHRGELVRALRAGGRGAVGAVVVLRQPDADGLVAAGIAGD